MKKYYLLLCLLFPFIVGAQQVNANKIELKDGLYYEIGQEKSFTGQAIAYYDNGNKQRSTEYKNGIINGKIESWYASGAKQLEGKIIDGQKSGVWTAWYENGNIIRQGGFENSKEEGEYIWWFENGKVNKKGIYHEGIPDGMWEWYYENGNKKQEGILRGETNDGTWKDWYENGKQKMIGTFKNGIKDGEWTWWDENGNITTKKNYKDGLLIEGPENIDTYIEKMEYFLIERDFKSALSSVEKAIGTIEDKSENNKIYMELALYHSKVYSYFQYLDEAETVLLKATGLPDNDIKTIVNANYKPPIKELKKLAERINNYPESKIAVGPHVALALIYNILGDTINLNAEQQLMMDRSDNSDWVITISLELYKIRGFKENTYGELHFLKEKISADGESKENQLQLANLLVQIGQFKEADIIAEKYLATDDKDIDFLIVKTNIEMSLGNLDKMKEYEKKILSINPSAFE